MSNIIDYLAPALMAMPGDDKVEAMALTNPRANEGRRASRRRSLEVVAEAQGDVDAFVKELEQKRRQLDEQIHKFIAQKEREFKLFERELRTRYRTPSTPPLHTPTTASSSPAPNKLEESGATQDASPAREKSHERESELLGLFTPVYLPLLESRPPGLDRSPSAPALTDSAGASSFGPDRHALQRSNTDPVGDASSNKPTSRLGLGPRTPSSGSDPGRNLVSALKSPRSGPRLPKQKRVSLVVGDEVVAPSDNIFLQADKSPERRSNHDNAEQSVQVQQPTQPVQNKISDQAPSKPSPPTITELGFQQPKIVPNTVRPGGLSMGFASTVRDSNGTKEPLQTSIESQDDMELASPFTMDEEIGGGESSYSDTTRIEDIDAETDSGPESGSTFQATSPPSPQSKDQPPFSRSPNLEIPTTRFRSSSSSSAQPISPGFSRPSVREDPRFTFVDEAPEETPIQGSFSRPSYSKQQTSGSLGESFMQRNAEEMMRRRQSIPRS